MPPAHCLLKGCSKTKVQLGCRVQKRSACMRSWNWHSPTPLQPSVPVGKWPLANLPLLSTYLVPGTGLVVAGRHVVRGARDVVSTTGAPLQHASCSPRGLGQQFPSLPAQASRAPQAASRKLPVVLGRVGAVLPGVGIAAYALNASRGVPSIVARPHHSSLNVMSGYGPPPGTMPPTSCALSLPLPSFHHSSASSKTRPPMHTPPVTELASMISCVNCRVAFACECSSKLPILELNASAPYSPRKRGASESPFQTENRLPNDRPLYLLMPQASTPLNAAIVSALGNSPWIVATGCPGSCSLMIRTASATVDKAFGNGNPA
mmetsp:Transcript_29993/g.86290  ORF Transcript_29993/g.86290 Transcript_29993/m.86290 type:complete len:320 (-) Transcript_29993:524-1483(-)